MKDTADQEIIEIGDLDVEAFNEFVGATSALLRGHNLVTTPAQRSEEHTSELQSLRVISYAVF